jgi:hypothetical protein
MGKMPLQVYWRKGYDANRFYRHLSERELQQRVRDIFLNIPVLNPDGKLGIALPQDKESSIWMLRLTQVLQEMQIRYGPYPNGFTNKFLQHEPFPNFVGEVGKKASAVFKGRKLDRVLPR